MGDQQPAPPELRTRTGLRIDRDRSRSVAAIRGKPTDSTSRSLFRNSVSLLLAEILGVEVVAHRHQLREPTGRTTGELDFLVRETGNVLCHWETAVKFYLHFPNQKRSHYIGPNAADDFDRKNQRLFEHQLKLIHPDFPNVTKHLPFVKGRIYYHPRQPSPRAYHRECRIAI